MKKAGTVFLMLLSAFHIWYWMINWKVYLGNETNRYPHICLGIFLAGNVFLLASCLGRLFERKFITVLFFGAALLFVHLLIGLVESAQSFLKGTLVVHDAGEVFFVLAWWFFLFGIDIVSPFILGSFFRQKIKNLKDG